MMINLAGSIHKLWFTQTNMLIKFLGITQEVERAVFWKANNWMKPFLNAWMKVTEENQSASFPFIAHSIYLISWHHGSYFPHSLQMAVSKLPATTQDCRGRNLEVEEEPHKKQGQENSCSWTTWTYSGRNIYYIFACKVFKIADTDKMCLIYQVRSKQGRKRTHVVKYPTQWLWPVYIE